MLYIEYYNYWQSYKATQERYNEILMEKEELFQQTQAKAITYDRDKVQGGAINNTLETYIEKKDERKIDERLEEAKSILDDRERLLKIKETELRASNHLHDKVYCMRYIDFISPYKIAKMLNYSKSEIYRILEKIDKNTKLG